MAKHRNREVHVDEIERLGRLGCTVAEAADSLEISEKSFKKLLANDVRVSDAWRRGHAHIKVGLRRKQLRLAGNNASMAIFLGKQMLGQRDVVSNEHSGPNGGPIETSDVDMENLSLEERKKLRELLIKTEAKQGRPDKKH